MVALSCQDQQVNVTDSTLDHAFIGVYNYDPFKLNFNHKILHAPCKNDQTITDRPPSSLVPASPLIPVPSLLSQV